MKKHFGEDFPGIHGILLNTSVVLVNHHHALAFPRPYLPNMVEVAGMHINPIKPLPTVSAPSFNFRKIFRKINKINDQIILKAVWDSVG